MSGREFDHLFDFERVLSESISSEAESVDDYYLGDLFEEKEVAEKKKAGRKPSVSKPKKTVSVDAMASTANIAVSESIMEEISIRTKGYLKRLEDIL